MKSSEGFSIQQLERVIAIQCYGPSGSIYLHSLFDGHPQIISTPANYLQPYHHFYEQYGNLPLHELLEKFTDYFTAMFDSRTVNPDWCAYLGTWNQLDKLGEHGDRFVSVDAEQFKKCVSDAIADETVTRKLFFQAVHYAYQQVLVPDFVFTGNTGIVFPLHEPGEGKYRRLLEEDFPRTQYITIVREPVTAVESWYNHDKHTGLTGSLVLLLAGAPVSEPARQRTTVVRLEDLNQDHERVTRAICAWLEIGWCDSLLAPTFCGLEWRWRQPGKKKVQLSTGDRFRLKFLLSAHRHQWHYCNYKVNPTARQAVFFLTMFVPLWIEISAALHMRRYCIEKYSRQRRFLKAWASQWGLTVIKQLVDARVRWIQDDRRAKSLLFVDLLADSDVAGLIAS